MSIKHQREIGPVTPEFVLDVIRDSHRHQCAFDPEADPEAELSFESSVAEWRDACDLVKTRALGAALNDIWDLAIPPVAWVETLEPPKARTLRQVCELIARHAGRTVIRPAGALGASCVAAGAFLAIRALLLRAGADPLLIRPSTPLAEVACRFPDVFINDISRLAPGRLPTVAFREPLAHRLSLAGVGISFLLLLASQFYYPLLWFAIGLGVISFGAMSVTARLRPVEVRFGAIRTFGELAEVIGSGKAV
jgi:hypothetical protein